MAQQTINIGSAPNDGTGDPLRDAFDKVNDNFTELYGSLAGLLELMGDTDCSANPNYPAASKGDAYYVTVAGKIGGASGKSVDIGDLYVAKADNAGGTEASVGTSWFVLEHNLNGAYVPGGTDVAVADGGTGSSTAAGARTNLGATMVGGNVFTLTNPSAVSFPRFNADNTVDALSAAAFRAAIGAGTGSGTGDLVAANNLSDLASIATARTNLSVYSIAQADAAIAAAVVGLYDIKGTTDCSANPNFPAALKGDAYGVSVAGKIGGASGQVVEVGDVYVAYADNAGGTDASVGSSWIIVQHNLVGAYVAGGTDVAVADGGTGSSTASGARTNLGLVIGTDVKAAAPSIQAVTSSATVTPTFADDQVNITAQAAGLTLANPTGTAVDGWGIVIRIKDNGTARSITFGSQYRAMGVTLPTTTVISKTLYLGMIYNAADTKWDVVAVAQEA